MLAIPPPWCLPCEQCGQLVFQVGDTVQHVCEDEHRLDHQTSQLRSEIEQFDEQLARWLNSPHGRFAIWRVEQSR